MRCTNRTRGDAMTQEHGHDLPRRVGRMEELGLESRQATDAVIVELQTLTDPERPITYGVVKPGPEAPETGVALVRGGDISNGAISEGSLRTITQELSRSYARTILRGGEVMMSLVGNPGEVSGVPDSLVGANLARQVGLIALRPEVYAPYVKYYLMSPRGRAELFQRTQGAVQQVINLSDLKRVKVRLPDRSCQEHIADILTAYDDLIANNRRRIALLEQAARELYREWFVRLRFPGHESTRIIDGVPDGWEKVSFAELAEFVNGYAFKPAQLGNVGLPIIKIPELKSGITAKTPRNPGDLIPAKYYIHDGDLLFSWSGTLAVNVWTSGDALLNQHLFVVKPTGRVSRALLMFALREARVSFDNQTVGATMRHIRRSALNEVTLYLPEYPLLNAFERMISGVLELIIFLNRQNIRLSEARDRLLPRLMSGEVAV